MKDKTNAYGWLPWAVVVAIVLAGAAITANYSQWYFLAPWSMASQVVTKIAINEFQMGIADTAPYWTLRISALSGIILFYVIGPSLWLYGELQSEDDNNNKDVLKKGAVWYLGAIFVVAGLQVIPTTVTKAIVFQNTWDMAEQHRINDELRTQLNKIGYDALELFYLPEKFGGGAGSFRVSETPGDAFRALQLTDLDNYSPNKGMTFQLQDEARGDSLITIHAISDKEGPDPNYRNADGREGRVEIAIFVRPSGNFDYRSLNAL